MPDPMPVTRSTIATVHGLAGYVFGYASLADPHDPLVRRTAGGRGAQLVRVPGRRRWVAGMRNRAAENDDRHYVDAETGGRPDVVVVTLSLEPGTDEVDGVAIPVTHDELARFDLRERRYDRIVLDGVEGAVLDRPLWTYTATARARADHEAGVRDGTAVVSHDYVRRVEGAFAARGPAALAAYAASTDGPGVPSAPLVLRRAHGSAAG